MSVRGPGRPLHGQLYTARTSFTKILAVGLERGLGGSEHQLLLQETQVQFLGPVWMLSTTHNSSSREDSPLLTSPDTRHLNDAHTYKQVKHSHTMMVLNEKHLPQSQAFECLVPSGWCCQGRLKRWHLVGGSVSLEAGFESLKIHIISILPFPALCFWFKRRSPSFCSICHACRLPPLLQHRVL